MGMFSFCPVIAALFLLAISFFVVLAIPKAETKRTKQFGRIVAILIWAMVVYLAGITVFSNVMKSSCSYGWKSKKFKKHHYGRKAKMYKEHHHMVK